jgi:ABC-type multidrug transport system fused ATPase/permease subunit
MRLLSHLLLSTHRRIVIDGVNIAAIPLSEVRSRLAIIPQEPVMFKVGAATCRLSQV